MSENVELSWTFRHHFAMRSRTITHQVGRMCESERQERTVIRCSPRQSHQSNGAVANYQKQLQGQVRKMLAAMQDRTQYRLRTVEGGVYVRSVRRIAEHIWSEANLQAVLETPQKPRSTTLDIPPAADPLALLPVVPEMHETRERVIHRAASGREDM